MGRDKVLTGTQEEWFSQKIERLNKVRCFTGNFVVKELINFRTPSSLIREFDAIADAKGISRTALLNIVITSFCRAEDKRGEHASAADTARDDMFTNETFEPVDLDAVFGYDAFEDLSL